MVNPHLFLAGEARVTGDVAHLDSVSKAFCVTDNRGFLAALERYLIHGS
jgi:hypothetical protein